MVMDFCELHDHFNAFLSISYPTNRLFLHYAYIKDKISAILTKHGSPFPAEMILPFKSEGEFVTDYLPLSGKWRHVLLNVVKLRCGGCWRCGGAFSGSFYKDGSMLKSNASCDHYLEKSFELGNTGSTRNPSFEVLEECVKTVGACFACNMNK